MTSKDDKVKRSLRYSFLDGVFVSAMTGFTAEYLTPFLLLLKATATHVAMLNALPNFFGSLIQVKSAAITESLKSRRLMMNIFVLLQAIMLLPMALIAFKGEVHPFVFIITVVFFTSFGAIAVPAWGSLMSDMVAQEERGAYFGWRNRVLGFITVGAAFVAGIILTLMKKINVFHGFAIVFISAFVFRLISWYFLVRMHEVPLEYKKENCFSFVEFISKIRTSNFARFVLFISLMSFSVNLGSPFFSVLMLRELHFSYLTYTIVTITAIFTVNLMMERWGRHADTFGNLKILRFTAPLIGVIPLLWLLSRHPVFLVCAQVFSGFMWAGFNLCASNFIYDAVTPGKRVRCISYFNVLNGTALSIGALTGGFLLQHLPQFLGSRILMLLLISATARITVGIFMPLGLKEVRPTEQVSNNQLFFSVLGIKPLIGVDRKTIRY